MTLCLLFIKLQLHIIFTKKKKSRFSGKECQGEKNRSNFKFDAKKKKKNIWQISTKTVDNSSMLPRVHVSLTNRMRFGVVCTLIDNDIRHHSGQNVVDSRGKHFDHGDDEYHCR